MQSVRVATYVYLGQNEDCILGDSYSSSDSSEKLLQRGKGERSVYR